MTRDLGNALSDNRHIEYMPIDSILPATSNPKNHAHQQIVNSVGRFGLASPPVLDERTGRLVAGHGRIEALTIMRDSGQTPPPKALPPHPADSGSSPFTGAGHLDPTRRPTPT